MEQGSIEGGKTETTDLFERIREDFALPDTDLRSYSPLTLAYIGDAVYDLVIRSVIVGRGNTKPGKLHQRTSRLVKAEAQSAMIDVLLPLLDEEEKAVYKRGRNAKPQTMPKHASASDYHRATGFEALMGYLYMKGRTERILFLVKAALDAFEEQTKDGTDGQKQ